MNEGREIAEWKSEVRHRSDSDAGWNQAEFWEKRCWELEKQLRQGPAYDVIVETESLQKARAHSEKALNALVAQVQAAKVTLSAASRDAVEAEARRVKAMESATKAGLLLDEVRASLASALRDAFVSGQKSRRFVQISGGFILGVLSSFVATWVFELFRDRLLP